MLTSLSCFAAGRYAPIIPCYGTNDKPPEETFPFAQSAAPTPGEKTAALAIRRPLCYHEKNPSGKVKMPHMEPRNYTVIRIEGEYAYLRADDAPADEALFIAMALLPAEVDVGTRLHYEMFCYTIIE